MVAAARGSRNGVIAFIVSAATVEPWGLLWVSGAASRVLIRRGRFGSGGDSPSSCGGSDTNCTRVPGTMTFGSVSAAVVSAFARRITKGSITAASRSLSGMSVAMSFDRSRRRNLQPIGLHLVQ